MAENLEAGACMWMPSPSPFWASSLCQPGPYQGGTKLHPECQRGGWGGLECCAKTFRFCQESIRNNKLVLCKVTHEERQMQISWGMGRESGWW